MRVNGPRLHESLRQMAQIGRTPGGGVTRLALSDEDRDARNLLRSWMEESGLTVRVDDFGNMVGRRPGTDPYARPVMLGSHCDSVRQGGRFDGVVGVLGALEVVRTLNDLGVRTRHPIEVINWTNEEGARFEPAMLCSGAVAGCFTKEYVYSRTDWQGLNFGEELRRIGYEGVQENRPQPGRAYLELHVEQGPVLDTEDLPVGVVEGIFGITWCEVTVEGQNNHAGSTPMHLRKDALVAAARIVSGVEHLVREVDQVAVGTVGRMAVEPNVINVIPRRVVFSVDFRHPSSGVLDGLVARLQVLAQEVASTTGTRVTVNRFWTSEPTPFAPEVVAVVEQAVNQLELPYRRLWSGPGHDAKYMQDICPSAMIFVRSKGGLSHCEAEHSAPADIEAGANVLLLSSLNLAGVVA